MFFSLLAASMTFRKTSNLTAKTWWCARKVAGAGLILDPEAVDQLVALPADGDWATVETVLAGVVCDSSTGRNLFGAALAKLMRSKCSGIIDAHVAELAAAPITQAALDANREQVVNELRSRGRDPMEAQSVRNVDVRYRGALIVAKVTSGLDEYCLKVDAFVRGGAVSAGTLPLLLCESSLVPAGAGALPKMTVDEAVLAKNRQARSTVEELLKNKTKSGISIQQAFEQHKYTLLQIDRSFRLEMSFFASVVGDGAESRLRDEVLSLLPKAGNEKTLQGVRACSMLCRSPSLWSSVVWDSRARFAAFRPSSKHALRTGLLLLTGPTCPASCRWSLIAFPCSACATAMLPRSSARSCSANQRRSSCTRSSWGRRSGRRRLPSRI